MPKVTKLERQKKRAERYSVFIDGKHSFSLTDNDLLASKIHLGQELSDEELDRLKDLSTASKLLDKVYAFLGYRTRTEAEIRAYLKRNNCHEQEIADGVVERLKQQKLISDDQFAKSWVSSRQTFRPRSRLQLQQELRQKGLDASLINETLAEVSDEDEIEAIKQIVKKKLVMTKYQDQFKLINYLLTQGFSYRLVKRALDDLGAAGSEQSVS